ncbi:hypothetical protein NSS79_16950 [Paenibacillus sp. FSL L8-0436]
MTKRMKASSSQNQNWKNFKADGGWDLAEGVFTWNPKTNKYIGSGELVLR